MADELVITRLEIDEGTIGADGRRPEASLASLVDHGLERALRAAPLPEGEWCIRELRVVVPDRRGQSVAGVGDTWSAALVDAVHRAIAGGDDGVVGYRHHQEALADLVGSVTRNDVSRAWAWRQLGLLDAGRDPATEPAATVLDALGRHPELALGVLVDVVGTGGFAPLDRALGAAGWAEATELIARCHGVAGLGRIPATQPTAPGPGWSAGYGATGVGLVPPPRSEPDGATWVLAADVVGRSVLAAAIGRSPLRLGPDRRAALAALCLIEVEPRAFAAPSRADLLDAIEASLPAGVGTGGWAPVPTADAARTSGDDRPGPAVRRAAAPHGPEPVPDGGPELDSPSHDRIGPDRRRPDQTAREGQPTEWAGLVLLLGLVDRLGLVDQLDGALAGRPLRWVLHETAGLLAPVPDDDPARRAFCGLGSGSPSPAQGWALPSERERSALVATAGRLRAAVESATGGAVSPPPGEDIVARLSRRPGEVLWEPGWLEVRFPLSAVDVWVRAAGLDLDPGWLAWLGVVVRFVYA